MKNQLFIIIFLNLCLSLEVFAQKPDWSKNAKIISGETRSNIYNLPKDEFKKFVHKGTLHTLQWPVTTTGMLIPYAPTKKLMEGDFENPVLKGLVTWFQNKFGAKGEEGFYKWLGLIPYPDKGAKGIFKIPYPGGVRPDYYMGVSFLRDENGAEGLTFSCAVCHTATVFGKRVMGLNNKGVRANEVFVLVKKYAPMTPKFLFGKLLGGTQEEVDMFARTKENLKSVGAIKPQVLGLDTSFPLVALSLAKRNPDPSATYSKKYQKNPRYNKLSHFVADSKPMPWWNLKYKTRWLSDGSIVSGNPALTNFLWNEIGRGTDLVKLEHWMKTNTKIIEETTASVFATKAPHWTDFFDASTIDIEKAKRGEVIFNNSCKKCHGRYEKAWSLSNAEFLSSKELLKTSTVFYHEKTIIKNVGTDPNRWMAMGEFSDALNNLAISKWMNTVIVPQEGYVPPPLVGIFARYPYFHNNSIPNLCELMKKPGNRTKFYIAGPSNNATTDYDSECMGYPVGKRRPFSWAKLKDSYYDATKPGLGNGGHSRMFYTKAGVEKISKQGKAELMEFLKTL